MRCVVFGCSGPVGVGAMEVLAAAGHEVVGVCRSGRADAPPGVRVVPADAADAATTVRLSTGADVIMCCVGLPYPDWEARWPPVVRALLEAAERSNARLVWADNLYAYGPQTTPLREDMPPTTWGRKPALRARMTRELLAAHADGRARVALVRASDFYGPRVRNSMLGERVFARVLAGKPAQCIGTVDHPHTFTYVPDLVRALVTVAGDEEAFGEIWHVPNAPAVTTRRVVELVAAQAGRPAAVSVLPFWAVSALAIVNPLMRELKEMAFQFDRPYLVDHAKFAARFGGTITALDEGLAATLAWYRRHA